jgi:hypothetical protein
LDGFETSVDREDRMTKVTTLAESGIILEQKFASAMDMSPFDFRRMMEESKANDFVEKLTPIIKASQMSGGGDSKNGRPKSSDSNLGDSGAETRGNGTDDEKGEG